jgi:hypothetical protein
VEGDLSEPYENVRYWDEEGWKKYFTEDLGSLYSSSIAVRRLADEGGWTPPQGGLEGRDLVQDIAGRA